MSTPTSKPPQPHSSLEDLRVFMDLLRQEKELVEIDVPVDPNLEAAEIHRRVIESQGPALLFKNIIGSPYPLVTNLFGTKRRVDLAFGKKPEELVRKIAELPETLMPPTLAKLWGERKTITDLLKVGIKKHYSPPVLAVKETSPKLSQLPLLKTWEQDGGAFITLPLVYTEDPQTAQHNLGMYRIQRYDDTTTGFHCQIGKGAGFHLARCKELNTKLEVNIHIGGPPALILAAIAPLPENVPELLLASLLQGKRLAMCADPISPYPLCANSEFILVGEVDPNETRPEGPFGDHYGYYSLQHDYPVFRCRAILRRKDPICTATVVGKPRQEDFFLGDYLQELLSPLFPIVMPAVRDLWSYGETGYHSLACAVVKQRYKREAMASAFRILGEGQLSLTKFLLVIDQPIDLKNFRAVLEHILARADFRTDLYIFSNLSMDTLDYNGPTVNQGSKGVLLGVGDPIRKLPSEFQAQVPPGVRKVVAFARGCLVIEGPSAKEAPLFAAEIVSSPAFKDWPLLVLVDNAKAACKNVMSFLWTTFTRFEPGAHIFAHTKSIRHNHISYDPPIIIDARLKPGFPDELFCDSRTQQIVNDRWFEYFPSRPWES